MGRTIILRFRDLVTETGATIAEHRTILRSFGEVWWGWWMRQSEQAPRALFAELRGIIETHKELRAYLFDAGLMKFYSCTMVDIKMAPGSTGISAPDPQKAPEYYQRGRYPAWFLLRSLQEETLADLNLKYDSFPSNSKLDSAMKHLIGKRLDSLDDLRSADATLWVVED